MDRDDAIELLRRGPDGVEEWNRRRAAGEDTPNLRNADFREAGSATVDLSGVNLSDLDLSGAKLHGARLIEADLGGADLTWATLVHAKLKGADLSRAKLGCANLGEADLSGAKLTEADLNGADLEHAQLHQAELARAHLCDAQLGHANLVGAKLRCADVRRARFFGADIYITNLIRVRGFFGRERAIADAIRNADSAIYGRRWDVTWWSRLRSIGTLRLFGASYIAFIAIVGYAVSAKWYNRAAPKVVARVGQIQASSDANAGAIRPDHARSDANERRRPVDWVVDRFLDRVEQRAQQRLAEQLERGGRLVGVTRDRESPGLQSVPQLPLPRHLAWQLAAIALLAVGATLYVFFCPDLIKEVTETKWARELDKPVVEYRSAAHAYFLARWICAICYAAGGSYTVWYLLRRGYSAFELLYSSVPS